LINVVLVFANMSKVCITIPAECKSCYQLCVEYCPDFIHINGDTGLPNQKIYLFAVDHFGNVWSDEIIINPDNTYDIDLSNYPSGFFNSNSGAVNIFLSENEDGSNPIEVKYDDGNLYTCLLITTQAAVDFVNEDVTIFNPGETVCGVIPGWTVVWGNIEGTIENQTDLIEYISNNTINCDTLPDCQTIIDINNTLAGKFDIPTGDSTQYLDGAGVPTLFPSIPAQYNPTAGTGISITGAYPNQTITNTDPDQIVIISGGTAILVTGTYPNFTIDNLSPDQIVALANGTGISVSGTYPNFTIDNTAPDQIVVLSNGSGISVTGSYPNFTITNTSPDQIVSLTASTGISIIGTYPNFTITNSAPDQTVSLTAGSGISVSGTYPNFTITNTGATGTVTSVGLNAGTGISLSGTNPITTSGTITVTNSAPDQVVSLTAGTGIGVSGTYPSFTISNTATSGGLKSGIATASVTDVYTTTITGVTSYTTNDAYVIKFNTANSNGATININGLGAVQLTKNNDVILTGGDISIGQEFIIIYDGTNFQMLGISPNQMFAYVTNADSVAITKGQPVYAFGASGDRMSVKLANNTSEATSSKTVGLVFSNSIASGGLGFVITQGVLSNVNTAAYTPGDTLYVGASAGALTNVLPTAPNHLTRIGIVERANAGNGLIYVFVQNGFQLDELSDVDITSVLPVNNDVLTYVTGVNNLWKPRSISTILGYTPVAETTWVDYSATSNITGWGSFTTKQLTYKIIGDTLFVKFFLSGTSNSTGTSFTLPYVSTNFISENGIRTFNNNISYEGFAFIVGVSNLVNAYYWTTSTSYTNTWTASSGKTISGQIYMEIGTTTLDFDAQNFISYAGITDATQKSAINQLVLDLKAYNLWNKITCIYPWVGGTATAHALNLKNPALFPLTFTAGWTHSSNGGTPTNAYANAGFIPSTFLTANNTHLAHYIGTDTAAGNKVEMAVGVGGSLVPFIGLYSKYTGNLSYSNQYNLTTNQLTISNTDARGFYIGSRTSSTLHKLYKNGSVIGTDTNTNSNGLPTLPIPIGCLNSNGSFTQYTDRQFRFNSWGQGFNDTEALNYRTAVQAFQTTLGRQV
jgi:hypothetical protein